jgi:hypothetical protein
MEILSHVAVAHELECVQQPDLGGIETEFEDIDRDAQRLDNFIASPAFKLEPLVLEPKPLPREAPMKAIRVHEVGGQTSSGTRMFPCYQTGRPRQDQGVGLNFLDCYFAPASTVPLPFTPGSEAAGTVAAIAPDVTTVRIGDRVSCTDRGAYAEHAVVAPTA